MFGSIVVTLQRLLHADRRPHRLQPIVSTTSPGVNACRAANGDASEAPGKSSTSELAAVPVPIIGGEPDTLPDRDAPNPGYPASPIIGTPRRSIHSAPNAPMIGTGRGIGHAELFADQFVWWLRARGLPLQWQVDDLVDAAGRVFSPSAGIEMPITRNLLGALKRRSDVTVQQDRRVYDRHGRLIGKRTFYTFEAGGSAAQGRVAGDDTAPTMMSRAA